MLDERLRERLEALRARYEDLEAKIADPAVISTDPQYADYLREHGTLGKELAPYLRLRALERERAEHEEARADPELKHLAEQELKRLEDEIAAAERGVTEALAADRKDAGKNVILEIRAGTGGEEAALFVADLVRMYRHYAERRGWTVEVVSANPSEAGGFKEIILGIQGQGVYEQLRHEGGGHRVQRVPVTESQGRIHTSAATVAVLPEAEPYEVELKPDELHVEVCRSQGPGGQSVNTTDSAVRIVHLPTGITVFMQDEKSQHKNKAKALRIVRSRVYDRVKAERDAERAEARRAQAGSGDRSQRVRTYNFPQNRVTDHRLGRNFTLDRVMDGGLDDLADELVTWGRQQALTGS